MSLLFLEGRSSENITAFTGTGGSISKGGNTATATNPKGTRAAAAGLVAGTPPPPGVPGWGAFGGALPGGIAFGGINPIAPNVRIKGNKTFPIISIGVTSLQVVVLSPHIDVITTLGNWGVTLLGTLV